LFKKIKNLSTYIKMELGRSIPAGDPREREPNPYDNQYVEGDVFDRKGGQRTYPKGKQEGWRAFKFHRPLPENRPTATTYRLPVNIDRRRQLINQAARQATGKDLPDNTVHEIDWTAEDYEIEDSNKRNKQINDSFREAKRRRNIGYMNQFVAQNVPAQTPMQRSFIPHDLRHMLSPE
jgi:hypothetical protein